MSVIREGSRECPAAVVEEHPQKIEEEERGDDDQENGCGLRYLQAHQDSQNRGEDKIKEDR